ncbi:SubName: Full=Uncharacterized protein {ECO:0000313/EMBL:CCA73180.1} [Serendipita indica DSM 11827]|uniref:Ubiquitin-like domain-containing protein n=1 Tax=Serendipita indica (strain DSM 11827) TaxID=1109443 RepID=G4TPD7_SERID|nr:SubName: Full=Uncharacterized protein {ECO:0000313/EMBL:CCA73180.1} [Serendipita indica DSM 11827]CCA73180.1 hypothetical protein PIIN_07134 [Serendipita indica DSM 11827]
MTSTTTAPSSTNSTNAVDEAIFRSHIESLKSLPVVFSDSYQAPPQYLPARISVFGLDVLPPPEKAVSSATSLADVLNLTFKSLKPAYSVTLPVQPADSILSLKNLLAAQASSPLSGATPAQQKLLLKGKALVDTKLVKDYDIKDGSVITVMMSNKPTTTSETPAPTTASAPTMDITAADRDPVPPVASPSLGASITAPGHKRRVSDIPAVTLSPAGTPAAGTTPLLQPIALAADPLAHVPLTASPIISSSNAIPIDLASIPLPLVATQDESAYHQTMSSPQFWKDLRAFLEKRFGTDAGGRPGDADTAFEEFLRSAKVNLSPHEIAKIRDEVGITGMGGH